MGNINAHQTGGGKQVIKGGNTNIKIGGTVVVIGILIIAILFGKGQFSSPEKQIVGTWETDGGFTYVFQSNGQYSHDGGWFGTYTVDGDTLTLCPVLNNPEIYKIKVSSNHLIIYEDGEVYRELEKIN